MPEIISRKEAIARGLKRYFTGKPCRNQHISERLVTVGHCVACARIRYRRNYTPEKAKKWRESPAYKNRIIRTRQKKRAYFRAWRAANLERARGLQRAYYERNKTDIRKRCREGVQANPEKSRKYFREKAREYRAKNPEKARLKVAKWRRENRERVREIQRKSRMKSYFRVEERVLNSNPKGELQWLQKNQVTLKRLKRILKNRSAGRPNGPNEAFPI